MSDVEKVNIRDEDVIQAIKNTLNHENFQILSQIRGNVQLTVTVLDKLNNRETDLNFTVKYLPDTKETFVYRKFQEFADQYIEIIGQCTAKCLVVHKNEYLILENLYNNDYSQANKQGILNYEQMFAVIQALARLHSCSLIFEEKFGEHSSIIDDHQDVFSNLHSNFYLSNILIQIKSLNFPETPTSDKTLLEITEQLHPIVLQLGKPSRIYKNVLSHGDLRASNLILTKNNSGLECKLINFESFKYAPPSHDVLLAIYLNTSNDFRHQYLYQLLGIYYNNLEKILKIYNYDLEIILPFNDFLDSCEEQKLYAAFVATGALLTSEVKNGDVTILQSNIKEFKNECYKFQLSHICPF
ncbi:hypothetical protein ABEB36_013121 [Hypothenemus hampei]|uniref:CHK kinase-like domain-containing protein n=1 Tax=Hypothenemus hampei TaxID=57062 RepID=A0ABD1E6W1_HYPHA